MTSSADLELTTYTVFDTVSGRPVRRGSCERKRLGEVPLFGAQTLFEGHYSDDCRFMRGQVMNVPPEAPPHVTVANIKGAAKQRLTRTDFYLTRAAEPGGKPVPDAVLAERARIRERSNELEAMIEHTPLTLEQLAQDDLWR